MTKLQLLHRAVNERLMAAVEQIMEMIGGTVLEYEEETIRVRQENEVLKRNLRWSQPSTLADWQGLTEPATVSMPVESRLSQQEERAVSPEFELISESTKTDSTELPAGAPEVTFSVSQGQENIQSYMAPLDFDMSVKASKFRHWREQNTRQRLSFACPDCGKVFSKKHSLNIHMRIHSKVTRYESRQRKTLLYGDKHDHKKLHGASQHPKHDDCLSRGSAETNQCSVTPKIHLGTGAGQEEQSDLKSESDPHSDVKQAPSVVRLRRGKKKRVQLRFCQLCPNRAFNGNASLHSHMRIHRAPENQQSSTNEGEGVKMDAPEVAFQTKHRSSKVWNYFSKDQFGKAVCHECLARLSQGSTNAGLKNTTNLWKHLRVMHPQSYLEGKAYEQPVRTLVNTSQRSHIKVEKVNSEDFAEQEREHFQTKHCSSKVWDYFSKNEFDEAVCHECLARVSQGSPNTGQKNTTNLWKHLRVMHHRSFLEGKAYNQPANFTKNSKVEKVKQEDFADEFEMMKIIPPYDNENTF